MGERTPVWLNGILLSGLLLFGCRSPAALPASAFPSGDAAGGWRRAGEARLYDRQTLFNLVDGQAEAYFAYRFEQIAVQRYEKPSGESVDIEVWQMATAEDAYGVFTAQRAGQPFAIGNAGDLDPGRRLAFWQNRYYVVVRARQDTPETDLRALAGAVSARLPGGGEPPALLRLLPRAGLLETRVLFFHEEISVQDRLWLGGENILGLSTETDGVLAEYTWEPGGAVIQLLLVQYPDAQAAALALERLQASPPSRLGAATVQGDRLGAVFGDLPSAEATAWLAEALRSGQ